MCANRRVYLECVGSRLRKSVENLGGTFFYPIQDPGWGKRRSHQGFQPICAIGFQHTLDILFDWHTTYPPDRVEEFLTEKTKIMDQIIRRELIVRGHDPR